MAVGQLCECMQPCWSLRLVRQRAQSLGVSVHGSDGCYVMLHVYVALWSACLVMQLRERDGTSK